MLEYENVSFADKLPEDDNINEKDFNELIKLKNSIDNKLKALSKDFEE